MRLPLAGLMLLALCGATSAEPYSFKVRNASVIPGVEKLEDLSCRVETHRLEQLAVSLRRGGYRPATQRQEAFFTGTYRLTTWLHAMGQKVDVVHRPDGTVCVWEFFPPPAATASAAPATQ